MLLNVQGAIEEVYDFFRDTDWGLVSIWILGIIFLFLSLRQILRKLKK